MRHDALDAHARDELGITLAHRARPAQAAVTSAVSFATGALLPLSLSLLAPLPLLMPVVTVGSVLGLGVLGAVAAYTGGAPIWRGCLRVMLLGSAAMGLTALVGAVFGVNG
jgi:VIT1/CCC1 family predicted Fe2+/Mn2+ transporter